MGPTNLFSMLLAGGILGLMESWVKSLRESKGFACVVAPALLFL